MAALFAEFRDRLGKVAPGQPHRLPGLGFRRDATQDGGRRREYDVALEQAEKIERGPLRDFDRL